MMKFENEAGLENFVCIVFELGDKMLTLSSMANIIVQFATENKGADQLRSYCAADLRLCLRICKKPVFSQRGSY